LRVPAVFADRLILRALRESGGTAIAVSDRAILEAQKEIAASEGIFCAPEGAATFEAARLLAVNGWIKPHEKVVLFNTGSGLKYIQ
jgi:threonine synthase